MRVDEEGGINTSEESEYTEDEEYMTDNEDDYEDVEGHIEEIEEGEEIEIDDDAEEIVTIPASRGPLRVSPAQPKPAEIKPWGIARMPATTQQAIERSIERLKSNGKRDLTLLLIGKNGAGKSSTGNELLNEALFNVAPFQQDAGRVVSATRRAGGFNLRVIDTPGLMDGDQVDRRALAQIQAEASQTPIDVVLYMDRADLYRVEPSDHEALEAVTVTLGAEVWRHTILTLTRAQMSSPPEGFEYDDFVQQRILRLQQAIKQAGGPDAVPYALVENSSKCHKADDGEKAPIPHKVPWRPALFDKAVDTAAAVPQPFRVDQKQAACRSNPNKRNRWWIPVILAAQVAFKIFVFDRLVEEDGVRGDENGPFDPLTVKEERQRLADEKVTRADLRQKEKEDARRTREAAFSGSAIQGASDSEESEEDEDEETDDDDSQ